MPDGFSQLVSRLEGFQKDLTRDFGAFEPRSSFQDDPWTSQLGRGITSVLSEGSVFEKAGVGFSSVQSDHLPTAASERRPELVGKPFQAAGVSLVFHPWNPHVPTTHLNVRSFAVFDGSPKDAEIIDWWVGGGFDLTPFYPVEEDCILWHRAAREALRSQPAAFYQEAKAECDAYFYLPHRSEARGIGGIFFDDHKLSSLEEGGDLLAEVVLGFRNAYRTVLERRRSTPYGERERQFQLYRRGRYAEFNLVHDRGTRFGLESGGRTESILMSLPPLARWEYGYTPEPDSAEARLVPDFLQPRQWIEE